MNVKAEKYIIFQKTHCVFCKYCTDMFYDYTNGPYLFMCEFNLEPTITETNCECKRFEDCGYEFDPKEYMERMKIIAELKKKIRADIKFNDTMHEISKKILFGDANDTDMHTMPTPIWKSN